MADRRPAHTTRRVAGTVPLARALSKLGLASRRQAHALILAGRVSVDGRTVRDPDRAIVPERAAVAIDGERGTASPARVLAFHKPRGVVTTRSDPEGRRTVFDVIGDAARGLQAVGRLDLASTGLLLLTNDTQFAHALTDPANAVLRRYVVTVRGRVSPDAAASLERGLEVEGPRGQRLALQAQAVRIHKASHRETHLIVELTEGKNRELRRLFAAIGHEATRIHRITFGDFELGALEAGQWREDHISSFPCRRSQRSASRQPSHIDATFRQKRRP